MANDIAARVLARHKQLCEQDGKPDPLSEAQRDILQDMFVEGIKPHFSIMVEQAQKLNMDDGEPLKMTVGAVPDQVVIIFSKMVGYYAVSTAGADALAELIVEKAKLAREAAIAVDGSGLKVDLAALAADEAQKLRDESVHGK